MPGVRLVLEVDSGEPEMKRIELAIDCPPAALYVATNKVMEEMRERVKAANNLALSGGTA